MTYALGILILVLGVLVSIALHELGHFIPAKKFGVYIPQFMVGFGPTLWSRKKGETEYGVKAILLGGYVRLAGMLPPLAPGREPRRNRRGNLTMAEETRAQSRSEIPPGMEARAFSELSVGKRLMVMLGGPLTNLLIAAVVFSIALMGIGLPKMTTGLGRVSPCVDLYDDGTLRSSEGSGCGFAPNGPAYTAGLREGDRIIEWNGKPVADWGELSAAVAASGNGTATVLYARGGKRETTTVKPVLRTVATSEGARLKLPFVGIGPLREQTPATVGQTANFTWQSIRGTAGLVLTLPKQLFAVVERLINNGESAKSTGDSDDGSGVMGLVGVGRVAGQITSVDARGYELSQRTFDMLMLIGQLNVALFAFNLLPLPPLDGAHIASALWEGLRNAWARVRRKARPPRVDTARLIPLTYAGIIFLVAMTALLIVADIVTPLG